MYDHHVVSLWPRLGPRGRSSKCDVLFHDPAGHALRSTRRSMSEASCDACSAAAGHLAAQTGEA